MVAAKTNCQIIGKQIRKKQIYIKNNKKEWQKKVDYVIIKTIKMCNKKSIKLV